MAAKFRTAIAVVTLILLAMFAGSAASAQITPSGDAYINTAAPGSNFGSSPSLNVFGPSQTTFIAFDLSSIPAGYTGNNIAKATLKLYVSNVKRAGSFNVDYVSGSWSETSLTAKNAPALGTTIAASVPLVVAQTGDYVLVDVTPALQAWLNGSQPNDGLALVANSSMTAQFESKENSNESHPPELDVVYASGIGTITGVTTASGSGLQGGGTSGTLNLGLTTACSANQVLQWSGSGWTCSNAGTGTITGVTAGTGLTGGGTGGNVTLSLNNSQVALLNTLNNGNLSVTGVVTGSAFQIGSNLFASGDYSHGNAFLGFAGNSTMTGVANTASGYSAFIFNTTGNSNTANGAGALNINTKGNFNTASGQVALQANSEGSFNTGSGYQALKNNTIGNENTATGSSALSNNITGQFNTGLGVNANVGSNSLTNATAIGSNALVSQSNSLVLGSINGVNGATADTKVGIGTTTPQYTLDVNGTGNFSNLLVNGQPVGGTGTITGVTAGTDLTGGGTSGNVTLNVDTTKVLTTVLSGNGLTGGGTGGTQTLAIDTANVPLLGAANIFTANQTVSGNLSATGLVTGSAFQIGSNLFAFGDSNKYNAFLGFAGNASTTGIGNTGIGTQALLSNITGNYNTANGLQAPWANKTGQYNTASGMQALFFNSSGSNNTGLGTQAGLTADGSLITADYNTFLGANTAIPNGTLTNATAIGAFAQVDQSNSLVLGSISGINNCGDFGNGCETTRVGIGTTTPQYTFDVHGTGNFSTLLVNGQPISGGGTITGVTAGTDLTGGGTSGNVTLNLDTTRVLTTVVAGTGLTGGGTGGSQTLAIDTSAVPQLSAPNNFTGSNIFTGNQTVNGNLSATGVVTGSAFNIGSNLFAFGSFAKANSFLGFAGNLTTTGVSNTAVGTSVFASNSTGHNNTAVGSDGTLATNSTGKWNTAIGSEAMISANGDLNTAAGFQALLYQTGTGNTAIGAGTLGNSASGSYNTALGLNATTGLDENLNHATAIGTLSEVDASNSLILGSIAGVNGCGTQFDPTCDSTKVGIGTTTPQYTLDVHGTGNFSNLLVNGQPVGGTGTITGVTAGSGLTGGGNSGNVTLAVDPTKVLSSVLAGNGLTGGGTGGTQTLSLDSSKVALLAAPNVFTANQSVVGSLNVSTSVSAASVNASEYSIGGLLFAYGSYDYGNSFFGFSGNVTATNSNNTAVGHASMLNLTSGEENTAVGESALNYLQDGIANTAIGEGSLVRVTGGNYNTGLGDGAGASITTGEFNTAAGWQAGPDFTTPDTFDTTAVGSFATVFQQESTAIGFNSVVNAANATAIGSYSQADEQYALVLGSIKDINNCEPQVNGCDTTNVGIGTTTPHARLDIGPSDGATGIYVEGPTQAGVGTLALFGPYGDFAISAPGVGEGRFVVKEGGQVGIGTGLPDATLTVNGTADKVGGGSWDTYSDGRLKTVHGQYIPGLNAILQLHPIRYRYKEQNAMGIHDAREHVGFVAQEVQKIIPDAVTSNDKGYLLVNNDPIILAMLNAIKEQQKEIAALRKQAAKLQATVTQLKQSRKEGVRLASAQRVP